MKSSDGLLVNKDVAHRIFQLLVQYSFRAMIMMVCWSGQMKTCPAWMPFTETGRSPGTNSAGTWMTSARRS
jgi:hypothetical protein